MLYQASDLFRYLYLFINDNVVYKGIKLTIIKMLNSCWFAHDVVMLTKTESILFHVCISFESSSCLNIFTWMVKMKSVFLLL